MPFAPERVTTECVTLHKPRDIRGLRERVRDWWDGAAPLLPLTVSYQTLPGDTASVEALLIVQSVLKQHSEYWCNGDYESPYGQRCAVGLLRAATAALGIFADTRHVCDRQAYDALSQAARVELFESPRFHVLARAIYLPIEKVNDHLGLVALRRAVDSAIDQLRAETLTFAA